MKKIIKATAVFIVLISFALMFASCSKLIYGPVKIVNKLDKEAYDSQVFSDSSYLDSFGETFKVEEDDIKWIITIQSEKASKSDIFGVLVYCKNYKASKEMQKDLEDYMDDNKEKMNEVKRPVVERKGMYVFIGSENVWEDLN